jgi:hypothetical protein
VLGEGRNCTKSMLLLLCCSTSGANCMFTLSLVRLMSVACLHSHRTAAVSCQSLLVSPAVLAPSEMPCKTAVFKQHLISVLSFVLHQRPICEACLQGMCKTHLAALTISLAADGFSCHKGSSVVR